MTTVTVDRDSLRRRALAIIREGRLTVEHAIDKPGFSGALPHVALVLVRSSRDANRTYAVDLDTGTTGMREWFCSCGRPGCAHIAAARIVTGGAS